VDGVTVQIRRRGVLTLPAELRRRYDIDEGETLDEEREAYYREHYVEE